MIDKALWQTGKYHLEGLIQFFESFDTPEEAQFAMNCILKEICHPLQEDERQ